MDGRQRRTIPMMTTLILIALLNVLVPALLLRA
jgi:hypothetical protein